MHTALLVDLENEKTSPILPVYVRELLRKLDIRAGTGKS